MANEIIRGMKFHHIALMAKDYEKSKAFYRALGLKELVSWGSGADAVCMLDLGDGGRIELFARGDDSYSESGKWLHFAVQVDDVEAAYACALAAGAESLTPPKIAHPDSHPYAMTLHIAFVKGPDGEQIEFFKELK